MAHKYKVIFIEWDGATWDVINKLLEQDKLPHLKKVMSQGSHATLRSESPMISARLWTSIHSGKPPAEHGVKFFGATSHNVKCKRVWDIAEEHGLRVGVFGSLITWPPRPVNGFMIPSVFALGAETYPSEYQFIQEIALDQRLQQHQARSLLVEGLTYARKLHAHGVSSRSFRHILGYLIMEKFRRPESLERYWRKAVIHLRLTGEVFTHLYSNLRPHLSTFHIHLCDAVSHRYWAFWEPEKFKGIPSELISRFRQVIPRSYQEVDRMIGEIAALADEETILLIASDHGFGPLPDTVSPYILDIAQLLKILGLQQEVIPARFGLDTFLNFQDTQLMSQMEGVLSQVTLPEMGVKFFMVKSRENYLELKIHTDFLRTKFSEETCIDFGSWGKYKFGDLFSESKQTINGFHRPEGMLVMAGPAIRPGVCIDAPTIYDLAPTLLSLLGLPVGQDMQGRVLSEVFTDEFLKNHHINYVPSHETQTPQSEDTQSTPDYEKIRERLQSLGYL